MSFYKVYTEEDIGKLFHVKRPFEATMSPSPEEQPNYLVAYNEYFLLLEVLEDSKTRLKIKFLYKNEILYDFFLKSSSSNYKDYIKTWYDRFE